MSIDIDEFLLSDLIEHPFFVLIGEQTDYSHSPLIHNTALEFHKFEGGYFALNVADNQLDLCKNLFAHPNFSGANVTIPYKKKILSFADDHDELVDQIGVANTIIPENGVLKANNTDIFGFLEPLKREDHLSKTNSAVVLGNGGAAQAVIEGLNQSGISKIHLVSRTPEDIEHEKVTPTSYDELNTLGGTDLVVNTTPVGMQKLVGSSPIEAETLQSLKPEIVYDLIYQPAQTELLSIAKDLGIPYLYNGLPMLIYQAGKSYHLWTGRDFPYELVFETLKQTLAE